MSALVMAPQAPVRMPQAPFIIQPPRRIIKSLADSAAAVASHDTDETHANDQSRPRPIAETAKSYHNHHPLGPADQALASDDCDDAVVEPPQQHHHKPSPHILHQPSCTRRRLSANNLRNPQQQQDSDLHNQLQQRQQLLIQNWRNTTAALHAQQENTSSILIQAPQPPYQPPLHPRLIAAAAKIAMQNGHVINNSQVTTSPQFNHTELPPPPPASKPRPFFSVSPTEDAPVTSHSKLNKSIQPISSSTPSIANPIEPSGTQAPVSSVALNCSSTVTRASPLQSASSSLDTVCQATNANGKMISRTQRKLLLQRLQTLSENTSSFAHPTKQALAWKAIDRVDREFNSLVMAGQDPMNESLSRLIYGPPGSRDGICGGTQLSYSCNNNYSSRSAQLDVVLERRTKSAPNLQTLRKVTASSTQDMSGRLRPHGGNERQSWNGASISPARRLMMSNTRSRITGSINPANGGTMMKRQDSFLSHVGWFVSAKRR
ncbi:hypothetical protein SeLEV6574_g06949 [Synchytrium endobioticum]|uniref:Uncharacterized protein n=1 Tax=Synchytrium endobioticum TaxID=286115 RepID=A0A507CJX6_9FUNG|nr:hypothetical protein SeLEV6574_g06949 [Synchytrium endobioticum]